MKMLSNHLRIFSSKGDIFSIDTMGLEFIGLLNRFAEKHIILN